MSSDPLSRASLHVNLANLRMLEELYERWLQDPSLVDLSWQHFFEGMQFSSELSKAHPVEKSPDLRAHYLINAYRTYGHLLASCNVIETESPSMPRELELENFGLTEADLDCAFPSGNLLDQPTATLREILEALRKTYCQTIGIEYMDLGSVDIETWIQQQIEPFFPRRLTDEGQIDVLKQLRASEGFETFLHTKYVGQKRFSLEGAESLIPTLHAILEKGGEMGVSDVILGMAHRGRLNVLANIMGKSYAYIFEEFEDYYTPDLSESTGDVKYHVGFAGTYTTKKGKKIQLILSANPSHLESVSSVVEGGVRALQEHKKSKEHAKEVIPLLVHGDAAIAGQGIVYETMGMRMLNGYQTGGTIHVVINNQIGFTALPKDSRSTRYCTDIAKAFGAPVFHVNGEDPEACVAVAHLSVALRQRFGCDVFIDLMGYRKYGHNESDEPTFTQPLQYQLIRSKKTIYQIYRDQLVSLGKLSEEDAEQMEKVSKEELNHQLSEVKSRKVVSQEKKVRLRGKHLEEMFAPIETRVAGEQLLEVGKSIACVPDVITIHPKVERLLRNRQKMLEQDPNTPSIDWGMGEMLAYGTLCVEGVHVRLSGQDVRRGTFSHRHALYVDQVTSEHHYPLSHLSQNQASCDVFNSHLSELGVLGFEFGYSLMYPNALVLWEGQYGDFANGAQVIIDQYIATSEMKWGHTTNLVLLLPHGYEGGGPEHSSARVERFLQLCSDENLFVVNCSTPAQLFHVLRRQGLRSLKKPLVLFTPKAMLRHPLCRSSLSEFTEGHYQEVVDDSHPSEQVKRVILCTGKIYFELVQKREKDGGEEAIIRIEQLYPLHKEKLLALIEKYSDAVECLFVQEEHQNMGAWSFLYPQLEELLQGKIPLRYVGRAPSASPAAGSHALHQLEYEALVKTLYQGNSHES